MSIIVKFDLMKSRKTNQCSPHQADKNDIFPSFDSIFSKLSSSYLTHLNAG